MASERKLQESVEFYHLSENKILPEANEMGRDIINIKGTKNGLVICINPGHDFAELKETLKSKIEAAKGFFHG